MTNKDEDAMHERALNARPLWKRNRARALALDHHMCRLCTFKISLEVHHIVPRADGGTDALRNLITLCPNHHALAHRNLITEAQFKRALARRKSTVRTRMADWSELIEHVARAGFALDHSDPRRTGEFLGRLVIELPQMLEVMFGPDWLTANRDSFLKILRDGKR